MRKWTRRGKGWFLHNKEGGTVKNVYPRKARKHLLWYWRPMNPFRKSKAHGRPGTLDLPATHDGWAQGISEE